ncbi:hypothetical protein Dimus_012569 [Dionaea muscipula]
MSSSVILIFSLIVAMDIAAGILSIEADISQKCKSTSNGGAVLLGVAASLALGVAHFMANLMGGCLCVSSIDELENSRYRRRILFACLIMSWCVVAFGLPMMIIGTVANLESSKLCDMSHHHMLIGCLCCFVHALLCFIWCFTYSTIQLQT